MIVEALPGLEFAIPYVEKQMRKVLVDRQQFGLSVPSSFKVMVGYCADPHAYAVTVPSESDASTVHLSILPSMYPFCSRREKEAIRFTLKFFQMMYVHLSLESEEELLNILENPSEGLHKRIEWLKEHGIQDYRGLRQKNEDPDFNELSDILCSGGKELYRLLTCFMPFEARNLLQEMRLGTHLRHEFDHVDFLQTEIYKQFISKKDKAFRLVGDPSRKDTPLEELAHSFESVWNLSTDIHPLMECRAMLSEVSPKKWKRMSYATLDKIVSSVRNGYQNGYSPSEARRIFVKYGAVVALCRGFNPQTINWVADELFLIQKGLNASAVDRAPTGVIKEQAEMILNRIIPEIQVDLTSRGACTAFSLALAFSEDPSRIMKAHTAISVDKYIDICMGNVEGEYDFGESEECDEEGKK